MSKEEQVIVSGKRKSAIAKASIKKGKGIVKINKIPYENYPFLRKLSISEPIEITKDFFPFEFDINVSVRGGGQESQIRAARLAIAKAIVKFTKSEKLRRAFLSYDKNLLVADVRRKEAYKPGDSKARRRRQKSYR